MCFRFYPIPYLQTTKVRKMVKEYLNLLAEGRTEIHEIVDFISGTKVGGRRIIVKSIVAKNNLFGILPTEISIYETIYWNPYKKHVMSEMYNYRQLGRKNSPLTNLWVILEKDIKDIDVTINTAAVKIKRPGALVLGSEEHRRVLELIKQNNNVKTNER